MQKDDHRATCSACITSLSSKGGKTTITPKHFSILNAITLQECHVFERYGVTITLMNLNKVTANVSASAVNIEGKLLQILSIVLVPFVPLCKAAFTICLCLFYFFVQGEYI